MSGVGIPYTTPQMQAVNTQDEIERALGEARLLASAINRGPGGREAALAITKLEEAQMWCDKAVLELEIARSMEAASE